LRVDGHGVGPLTYVWFRRDASGDAAIASGLELIVSATLRAAYFVEVSDGCGSTRSDVVSIGPTKARAVRK
jgi:hypothetical protein